jgi:hypothetical protein
VYARGVTHAPSGLSPGAACARHAQRVATGVCSRCGDYLCGSCGKRVDDRLYCPPCAERLGSEHGPRAALAFLVGLASVHFLFFLAPIAIALSVLELWEIRAGQSATGGRGLAVGGLVLGVAALLMAASTLVLVLIWRAR